MSPFCPAPAQNLHSNSVDSLVQLFRSQCLGVLGTSITHSSEPVSVGKKRHRQSLPFQLHAALDSTSLCGQTLPR